MTLESDREALQRAIAGDRDAQRLLFEQHAPRVRAIALGFFGDQATASDVVQEVFVKLLSRAHQFRGDAALSTWLHRLVVNACLDERRAVRRLVAISDAGAIEASGPGLEERAERRERDEIVREAVAGLSPPVRLAVLLRYFHDLSYEEMASAMGCSSGTVASRLSRGHAALARSLAELEARA
jgi:RNA polymerase sigma-70 factor (ECF subfamily)